MPPRSANPAQQAAHPVDAGRVEPVGRLVEDEHLRVAEQGVGDAEPLPHAQGVVPDAALGLRAVRPTSSSISSTRRRQPHHIGAEFEDLAAGAAGVLRRGVEQDADMAARVGQLGVAERRARWPARLTAG